MQCHAKTLRGSQCGREAEAGKKYCFQHRHFQGKRLTLIVSALGAAVVFVLKALVPMVIDFVRPRDDAIARVEYVVDASPLRKLYINFPELLDTASPAAQLGIMRDTGVAKGFEPFNAYKLTSDDTTALR